MTAPTSTPHPAEQAARRRWMAVLARSSAAEIAALLAPLPPLPPSEQLRPPETGLIMVRARMDGNGALFNLGEMTVTRCSLRCGPYIGHAYVAGRDHRHAELAALLDAALQDPTRHEMLMRSVIEPLAARQQAAAEAEARKAAATKVTFFAMQTTR